MSLFNFKKNQEVKKGPSPKKEGAGNLEVKILGSGCAKCNQLEEATLEALEDLGLEAQLDHVRDFEEIVSYGVMTTPALVVDGKLVSYGRVLKKEDLVKVIQEARGL
ncbi:MAG: thioredoxin family protein [Tissierellia bacterium]|nr:thioredoxin family protein [Tissierellia bacterium]